MPELPGRQVEPDLQVDAVRPPDPVLTAHLLQHPVADRLDQPQLLGQRDEVGRRDQPSVGVGPPDQRLDTDHRAGRELDHRLVVQDPLRPIHGLAQPRHVGELRLRIGGAPRGHHVTGGPGLLRLTHRRLGVVQQVRGVRRVLRVEADADAHAHVQLRAVHLERIAQHLVDPLRDGLGADQRGVELPGAVTFQVGEQQQELIAALARHQIGLARRDAEPVRQLREEGVAVVVTKRVVHQREVVHVHVHDGDRPVVAARAGDRQLQELLEHRPVRQAGEVVVVSEERDLLLRALALGDVHHHALRMQGLSPLVPDQDGLVPEPDHASVLGDHAVLHREGLAGLVVALVLREGPLAIVRMQHPRPHVLIGNPLLRRVAQDRLDLRADVEGRRVLTKHVDVGDRRQLLDHRAEPALRGAALALGHLPLDRGAECPGGRPQRIRLHGRPFTARVTVVEAQEAPPRRPHEDRHDALRHDRLRLQHPALDVRGVRHGADDHVAPAQHLDPASERRGVREEVVLRILEQRRAPSLRTTRSAGPW